MANAAPSTVISDAELQFVDNEKGENTDVLNLASRGLEMNSKSKAPPKKKGVFKVSAVAVKLKNKGLMALNTAMKGTTKKKL